MSKRNSEDVQTPIIARGTSIRKYRVSAIKHDHVVMSHPAGPDENWSFEKVEKEWEKSSKHP